MQFNKLFSELKRRNVIKVATAYAIVGWLIIQVIVAVNEPLSLPDWFDTAVIIIVATGFPIALIVAWAFELTPEGIRKTEEVHHKESITKQTGQRLNRLIITALVILIAFLLVERIFFAGEYGTAGEASAKNVPEPASVAAAEESTDRSVAVLPFADFSPEKDQEWFADGLTDEILNSLVKIPDLKVAARTSSFKYKGTNEEIPVIATALGVDHVLEGSIRRSPERLRVTAQLIRASDGFHVWSETYDRLPQDAIKIQVDLATSIARALNTAMDTAAIADMIRVGTSSVDAYNAYLEGISVPIASPEAFDKRIKLIDQARTIDPDFSEAHFIAALYWSRMLQITATNTRYRETDYDKVLDNFRECIQEAIRTSSNELDILKYRLTEAEVNLYWRTAEKLYEEYLQQRPKDLDMIESYIQMLFKLREKDKAGAYVERLKNEKGESVDNYIWQIFFNYRTGNYQVIDSLAEAMIQQYPSNPDLMYQVQRALLWSGKVEKAAEAADHYETFAEVTTNQDSVLLYTVRLRQLCGEGNRRGAQALYEEIMTMDWELTSLWHVYMVMNETDKAREVLRELDKPETIRQFTFFLYYRQFDPRPYPELMKIVEREQVRNIEPVDLPFALPPLSQ